VRAARGAAPSAAESESTGLQKSRLSGEEMPHFIVVLIRPPLGAMRFMDFERAEELIALRHRAARQALAA
jgi:predicted acylesterase/phospholipase RssA